jgi:hypothetical protein
MHQAGLLGFKGAFIRFINRPFVSFALFGK